MANRKISDLTSLTAPATGDLLPIVDISEAAAVNKNKKITYGELLASAPAGTAAAPSFSFDSDPNSGLYSAGADQVAITTGGTGRLFVDASGNVALGAATFSKPFTITNQNAAILLRASSTGTFSDQGIFFAVDGTNYAQIYNSDSGQLIFRTGLSLTERLRITSAGLVGVGTSAPLGNTHIRSSSSGLAAVNPAGDELVLESSSNCGMSIIAGNTGQSNIYFADSDNPQPGAINYGHSDNSLGFRVNAQERARIDSSGRLLVGTSTTVSALIDAGLQVQGTGANSYISSGRWVADANASGFIFNKSRGATVGTRGIVQNGDGVGAIFFTGDDGTNFVNAAIIIGQIDGTPGTNDMPGRLVFSTTPDGAANPTERFRITNDGVIAYDQPAPATYAAAATLTVADLKTGIITYTGTAATLTLPTGTLTEGGFSGIYTNMAFEWSVINTGAGICTIGAATAHTIVGTATVAIGASARFTSRRTAANTFVSYRLA